MTKHEKEEYLRLRINNIVLVTVLVGPELKLGKMVEASMQPGNTSSFNDDDGADAAGEVDVVDLNVGRHNLRVRSVRAKRSDDDVGSNGR